MRTAGGIAHVTSGSKEEQDRPTLALMTSRERRESDASFTFYFSYKYV